MAWTDERIDQLKKLWAAGCSAGQIAAELHGVTRNAVIGKVHRLGLNRTPAIKPGGPFGERNGASRKRRLLIALAKATTPRVRFKRLKGANNHTNGLAVDLAATEELPPETPLHGVTMLELEKWHCRWPCGDPGEPDFLFCGEDVRRGFVYCAGHARMAYAQPTRRR